MTTRPRRRERDPEEAARRAEERREEARRRLEAACEELRSSEGWQRFAKARALLRGYSLNNTLLILSQSPDASVVASYRRWAELGRQVRRGERALRVWAPSTRRERDPASGEEAEVVRTWVLVPVFDVSQTDGPPLPEPPRPAPLTGSSHAHLLPNLERGAGEAGYSVERRSELPRGTEGYVDHARRLIVLSDGLSANGQVAVLVHELAHVHGARYSKFGRAGAEVVAETAAFVVLSGAGLDTRRQSVPYVAGWADAAPKQMAAYAEAVHRIATLIERDLRLGRTLDGHDLSPAGPDEARAAMSTTVVPAVNRSTERLGPDSRGGPHAEGRVYVFRRDPAPWIEVREPDGTTRRLRHRVRHSRAGLDWGYGGSGPADAALSILWDHLGDEPTSSIYQSFKWNVVAHLRDGSTLGQRDVNEWRTAHERGRAFDAARTPLR
jgi:hypothetical protein